MVSHAVEHLFRPDELDLWSISWQRHAGTSWELVVDLQARGEHHFGYVTESGAEYDLADGLDTFTDGLEDFISESRFAWGQRRELADRPWRSD